MRKNSPGTGARKIIAPAAQQGRHTDPRVLLYYCVFVWQRTLCVHTCMCLHSIMCTYFSPCSISLTHKSALTHGRAILPLSNWWSIQIKMNLHHANRGSGEQSAGSLQSARIAGGLSQLSSELLSLNQVSTLPFHCKPTGRSEFTAAPVWIGAEPVALVTRTWLWCESTTDDESDFKNYIWTFRQLCVFLKAQGLIWT